MRRHRSLVVVALVAALTGLGPGPAASARATRLEVVTAATPVGDRININTAGVEELMTLHGVGRTVAERIVQYREAHGAFARPEDLQKVQGIGPALWERNRARLAVE